MEICKHHAASQAICIDGQFHFNQIDRLAKQVDLPVLSFEPAHEKLMSHSAGLAFFTCSDLPSAAIDEQFDTCDETGVIGRQK